MIRVCQIFQGYTEIYYKLLSWSDNISTHCQYIYLEYIVLGKTKNGKPQPSPTKTKESLMLFVYICAKAKGGVHFQYEVGFLFRASSTY